MAGYGFSNVVRTPSLSNNFNSLNFRSAESILKAVRVKYILLDDSDPIKFKKYGEWNGLGTIEYELVPNLGNSGVNNVARPLNPNYKMFPLLEEIVYIVSLPDTKTTDLSSTTNYYITNIGLWNHPHHNGYPTNPNNLPDSQQKDYIQTQAGSVRRVTDQSTEINLGKTFKERANIHPLLPFEGDIIHEGRWGNSIRLGSTVKDTPNNWSGVETNGDPITIIRNGQGTQTNEGWIPITENINNDDSSIYLTSTQQVPIKVSSDSYESYINSPPEIPNEYNGKQILLNSGRLIFNSTNDHILLSSIKSINLNSQESINIDTPTFIVQSNKMYLGSNQATEPLLLGDSTVDLLRTLILELKSIATTLQTLVSTPSVPGVPVTFPTLIAPATKLAVQLEFLDKKLDTITSKRNFTI